ncbi:MAG TPA: leucine dehydrogenase [Acidobacteria bacterium]|nr:leucine dehydrogenase [Acidobacteriota bacterium]
MELFQQMAGMGHERVLFCSSPEVGLQAIIAVHSTVLGPGLGGARMFPYQSMDEALTDVLRLSRGMTYKAAVTGLNLGGGKAVILGDPKTDKTEALFRTFGRFVDSLGGLYITAEDVGTDVDAMEWIYTETPWVTGVSAVHGGSGDPSPVTAFGVLQGIKASARFLWGSDSLAGRAVAIQGLGNVGYHLGKFLLEDEKAKVFGADVDGDRIARAREAGVEIVPKEQILEVDCDVVAPCALGAILDDKSIPKLKCKIVAGAANNQLADEKRDGRAVHDRGILYAPDFVINAGGLINVYHELTGYNRERAMRAARGIYNNMLRVYEISHDEAMPTYQAADRLAEERIARVQRMAPQHWGQHWKKTIRERALPRNGV